MGDIRDLDAEALVNPANSYGFMGGGVALSIKRNGGANIETEAISKAPIPIGDAIITSAGNLKAKYIVHAPTMEEPAQPTNLESIAKATSAALKKASDLDISSIAFPGMGTGVGKVPRNDAALIMLKAIKKFINSEKGSRLKKIFLVAHSHQMQGAFLEAIEKLS